MKGIMVLFGTTFQNVDYGSLDGWTDKLVLVVFFALVCLQSPHAARKLNCEPFDRHMWGGKNNCKAHLSTLNDLAKIIIVSHLPSVTQIKLRNIIHSKHNCFCVFQSVNSVCYAQLL